MSIFNNVIDQVSFEIALHLFINGAIRSIDFSAIFSIFIEYPCGLE